MELEQKIWFLLKNLQKINLTDQKIEKKLENFRKQNKNYLYPSFDTIAGSGSNGAIIHYCLLYTSPSPRDVEESRMPSSA